MLINDPTSNDNAPRQRRGRTSAGTIVFLTLAFLGVLVLRNDAWNWHEARPLLFGFLPVGLWWQMLVSLAASGFMWLCVKLAWPDHLEDP